MPDDSPLSPEDVRATYNDFAARYAARVESKPHNAYYDRPATLGLLPDVNGLRLLDAGCGPGLYTEWLLAHGAAHVTAVDISEAMIALAAQRVPQSDRERVTFHRASLTDPLDFLADGALDAIVSGLVLDYIADWEPVFVEFARVLRPGGVLAFSCTHPVFDVEAHNPDSYFDTEAVCERWSGFGGEPVEICRHRRPLGAIFAALNGAGLVLERFLEPLPTEAFRAADPEDYADLLRRPGFLCIRAAAPA